ncbi:MAG: type II toxin-antitoxin system Phd/YefM family antitoxin [Gemmatimonadota bacterium]|nr:type II toxin-antitoxin system Phd/YefM family antitoxin [Gemmatimonadota bacterium]
MPTVKPTEDIQPLSAFRANVASFVDQVRETGRPLVLTQHGRSSAVLLGAADYEALIEELEVLRDIQVSERELAEGRGIPHDQVAQELREIVRSRLAE